MNILEAKNLRDVEGPIAKIFDRNDKSDPFVQLCINDRVRFRTRTIQNNLHPLWDESTVVILDSERDNVVFKVMDDNEVLKDQPLGSLRWQPIPPVKSGVQSSYPLKYANDNEVVLKITQILRACRS